MKQKKILKRNIKYLGLYIAHLSMQNARDRLNREYTINRFQMYNDGFSLATFPTNNNDIINYRNEMEGERR
jgi:hypothetical protein